MNRKTFIGSIIPAVASLQSLQPGPNNKALSNAARKPAYLKSGDIIGICCCSNFISLEDIQPAVNKMKEWGFAVSIGATVGKHDFTFGGSDDERRKDLQTMLDDPQIKAIMFARGGYGAVRILDIIDFDTFLSYPKWLIGFSDATIFHAHVNTNLRIATIHSKMCNSFPADFSNAEISQVQSIESIRQCLTGEKISYATPSTSHNRFGTAEGILTGGNLSMLQNIAGTKSDIDTRHKILFLEDVDEYLYSIDRLLWNLLRNGKFDKLHGLIIGGFNKIKKDDPGEEFKLDLYEMVMEKVSAFDYPVCFDFPVGHQKHNVALKCGLKHRLAIDQDTVLLTEI